VAPGGISEDQRVLWRRVEQLWDLLGAPEQQIRSALHPDYSGWVGGDELPHDREAGVRAAAASPPVVDRELTPLHIGVHGTTGIVHYRYRATVDVPGHAPRTVTGRWTEVYVGDGDSWLLMAVSGGPDAA
jgi:hypothetical protein